MKKYALFLIIIICGVCFNMSCSSDTELDLYSTISGQVTDIQTGEPIKGASIMLKPGGMTTVSGSDGLFEFVRLTPRQYTVFVQAEGYISNRKDVTVEAGESRHVDIPLSKQ